MLRMMWLRNEARYEMEGEVMVFVGKIGVKILKIVH